MNIDWDKHPKGVIGWVLWSLPQKTWKYIIWLIGIFIGLSALLAFYQLWSIRDVQINQLRASIFTDQWERSDSVYWRIALLRNWSEPNDITSKIWLNAAHHKNYRLRLVVAESSYDATFNLVEGLRKDTNLEVRLTAIFNQSKPNMILTYLANDPNANVRQIISQKTEIPLNIISQLAEDSNVNVRKTVAENKSTPKHILKQLSVDSNAEVRSAVAKSKSTSPDVFRQLAKDRTKVQMFSNFLKVPICYYVAGNESTPSDILDQLSKDLDAVVRSGVAWNKSAPVDALRRLSKAGISKTSKKPSKFNFIEQFYQDGLNRSPSLLNADIADTITIRSGVAWNESTPPDVLRQLSKDSHAKVRSAVAKNKSTPLDVLMQLAKDSDTAVQSELAESDLKSPDLVQQLLETQWSTVISNIAQNESTPLDVLKMLSTNTETYRHGILSDPYRTIDYPICLAVAMNKSTPADVSARVFSQLVNDPDVFVREAVAECKSTPPDILSHLSRDSDVRVREEVSKNESTPPDALRQLFGDSKVSIRVNIAANKSTPPDLINQLVEDSEANIREAVAKNESTPIKALRQLAQDRVSSVLYAVLMNPRTPRDIILALLKEPAIYNKKSISLYALDRLINSRT